MILATAKLTKLESGFCKFYCLMDVFSIYNTSREGIAQYSLLKRGDKKLGRSIGVFIFKALSRICRIRREKSREYLYRRDEASIYNSAALEGSYRHPDCLARIGRQYPASLVSSFTWCDNRQFAAHVVDFGDRHPHA